MTRTDGRLRLAPTRVQLLLAALVLLALSLLLTALVGRWVLRARLDDRIDRELAAEVDEFQRLVRLGDPRTGEPFGDDAAAAFDLFFASNVPGADGVFLGIVGDRPYLRSADARYPVEELDGLVRRWSRRATATFGVTSTPGGSLRYLVSPVTDADGVLVGTLVVGRFPDGERSDLDAAAWTVAVVGLTVIVLAGAASWAVLRRRPAAAEGGAAVATPEDESADAPSGAPEHGAHTTQVAFLEDAERELRAPVTVVKAHLENADLRRPLDAASREVVLGELDRMGNIVADLSLLAEAARPDFLHPEPVDVAQLTEEIVTRGRKLAERAWDVRPGTLVVARLDRDRVVLAWMHLVRNAVAHTWRSDQITVFSAAGDSHLELGVVDSGQGMTAEEVEQLFEPFRRGSGTPRISTGGGGLGLTVARAVAEAHGGRVEVRDTPGGGATVLLSVPLVRCGPLDEDPHWSAGDEP